MNRSLKSLAALTSAAVLTFGLAACSNSEEAPASSGAKDAPKAASATFDVSGIAKDESIASLLPDNIKSSGTLKVVASADYPPAEFMAEDGTTMTGYETDFMRAVAKVLGVNATFTNQEFDSLLPSIGPTYDVGASSFTITPEREEQVLMVSHFKVGSAWGVEKGNPKNANPVADPCGLTVGVQNGTAQMDSLNEMAAKCDADGKAKLTVKIFDLQGDATTQLAGGAIDAIFADSSVVGYAVEQTGGKIEQVGGIVEAAPQGLVVAKNNEQLAKALQAAVQKLMDDGTLKKALEAYGVSDDTALSTSEINPTVES